MWYAQLIISLHDYSLVYYRRDYYVDILVSTATEFFNRGRWPSVRGGFLH